MGQVSSAETLPPVDDTVSYVDSCRASGGTLHVHSTGTNARTQCTQAPPPHRACLSQPIAVEQHVDRYIIIAHNLAMLEDYGIGNAKLTMLVGLPAKPTGFPRLRLITRARPCAVASLVLGRTSHPGYILADVTFEPPFSSTVYYAVVPDHRSVLTNLQSLFRNVHSELHSLQMCLTRRVLALTGKQQQGRDKDEEPTKKQKTGPDGDTTAMRIDPPSPTGSRTSPEEATSSTHRF